MKSKAFNISFFIELALGILGIFINTSSEVLPKHIQNGCVKAILWLLIIFPIIVIISHIILCFLRARKEVKTGGRYAKKCIDTFDNQINQNIMMAKTFRDLLYKEKDISASRQEIKKYYFIQGNYYLNKSIFELTQMKSVIKEIFEKKDVKEPQWKISYDRTKNLIEPIKNLRKELIAMFGEEAEKARIKYYDSQLNTFENYYNDYINSINLYLTKKKKPAFGRGSSKS